MPVKISCATHYNSLCGDGRICSGDIRAGYAVQDMSGQMLAERSLHAQNLGHFAVLFDF